MSLRGKVNLVLAIFGTIALVTVVGLLIKSQYGSEWFPLLNVAVSAALSAALVLLYFRQSAILQSQKKLLKAEMNRGVREQHTETLRERVRKWHGNPDRETSDNPLDQPSKNLPSVGVVSFASAPAPTQISFSSEEDEFRVIPRNLENDRYLKDLLNNHALDLKEQAERIRELQEQFDTYREQFCDEFDYHREIQFDDFSLEPEDHLHQWFFEHLIRFERNSKNDFTELHEQMVSEVVETGYHPDKKIMWIMAEATQIEQRAIYGARYDKDGDADWQSSKSEIVSEVEEVVCEIVMEIESDYPFEKVTQAADMLEKGEIAVDELEQILIEYDGKPIYQGDCEYLRETKVDT